MKENGFFARLMHPVDLTQGTPWRVILRYAAPIMFSYFLQQIYTMTDAVICGQVLTASEVAGVNDTGPLSFLFLQFAFGCTAGFSVITANFAGRGDAAGVRRSFAAQFYLSLIISGALTVLSLLLLPWLLSLLNLTPEHADVYTAAYHYCFVLFLGIFAQMAYNGICGILRAYGDSVTPLLFLVISTALNIGLDILFLVPFRMGPAGAAAATVLAQFVSVIGCLVYTFLKYPELRLRGADMRAGLSAMGTHLAQGVPLGLQFSVLAVGIIVMQGAVVAFDIGADGAMVAGTPAQNGYGAACRMVNFLMAAFNGLGAGILGYNAQNFGRGDGARIRRGTRQSLCLMAIISVLCLALGMLFSIGGGYQYVFMSADKVSAESIRYGNTYLYVALIFYIILGFLIVVRSAVQGISRTGYVLGAGLAELVARIVICSALPPLLNGGPINASASHLAFVAVCFGDPGAWLCASLLLLVPLFRYIEKEVV